MNEDQAVDLCRYVAAACPQQKFDEYTPDVWFDLLGDLPFDVALIAAQTAAKAQPFVAPAEIRRVVKRMRTTTRRAVRQRARDLGVIVNVEAEADAAITSGRADFTGIDLLHPENAENYYAPEQATLVSWQPSTRLELAP